MRNKICCSLLALLPALTAIANPIRIAGSDLIEPTVSNVLKTFDDRREDIEVVLDLRGSSLAFEALQAGQADIVVVAVPDGTSIPTQYKAIPFAFEVASVIVHEQNPIKELRLEQLSRIFSSGESEVISNWGGTGVLGPWQSRTVSPHILDESAGITHDLFNAVVSGGRPLRSGVHEWETLDLLRNAFSKEESAIAVIPGAELPSGARALLIGKSREDYSYAPASDSVYYGDYPLRLPYYIVFQKAEQARLKDVIRELLTDDTAKSIVEARLIPAPASERREQSLLIGLE